MESVVHDAVHSDLQRLNVRLQQIHEAISNFQPLTERPPILDSSLDVNTDAGEDSQLVQQEHIPGLKNLRDNIKIDLDVLQKFLDDPESINLPPLSTNAPYLIAVWNEVLCAPAPIVSVFKTFPFQPTSQLPNSARKRGAQRPPGAKVDVVADNGRRWIRVNTVKNSRILSEFREIDSYLTDSEDDSNDEWDIDRPTLAQTEFDNSILRMGRSLLQAAKANPIIGCTSEIPKVTLRLTRLDPNTGADPRIAQTIQCLLDLGVDVELGERGENELPILPSSRVASPSPPPPLEPTPRINLDLSVLIAVISDLTHAQLPLTIGEANRRFVPPQEYCEWKQKRQTINGMAKGKPRHIEPATDEDTSAVQHDLAKHSRALTNQLLQEMGKGILQEIHDKILAMTSSQKVEFWTTPEARDRCLRIVSKIGGPNEKRRAFALFSIPGPGSPSPNATLTLEQAEDQYWQNSRYPSKFIPLLPLRLYPAPANDDRAALLATFSPSETRLRLKFHNALGKTCEDILAQETIPHPRALPEDLVNTPDDGGEIQRAIVTKANPRLTAHTVQSMLWGADLGWTTLTANRMSVKAILREMKIARVTGRLDEGDVGGEEEVVKSPAIWVVDPRSLAEGMSSLAANSSATVAD